MFNLLDSQSTSLVSAQPPLIAFPTKHSIMAKDVNYVLDNHCLDLHNNLIVQNFVIHNFHT